MALLGGNTPEDHVARQDRESALPATAGVRALGVFFIGHDE